VCRGGVQCGARREIDVAQVLFEAPAAAVRPDQLEARVRAGARRLVVDGETDADLEAAARAVGALDGAVVTASPGAWLRFHPLAEQAGAAFGLVVLGSNTELNHRQLAALRRRDDVVMASDDVWAALAGGDRTVVVETIGRSRPDDVRRDPAVADHAADVAAALLGEAHERGLRCRGLVASGGHMASRLVDALGAQRLAVEREVEPLCPRGTVAGGAWSGLPVITKGGLVGSDETLCTLVDDLWRR
jgi:uncharacterized protein YgbK (DUF1537 family)